MSYDEQTHPEHHDGLLHALYVHIVGDDTPAKHPHPAAPHRRERLAISTHTIVLTAANPVQALANHEPNRKELRIQSADNPVVLCDNQGQALDPANQVSGLPNPNGALLPVTQTPWEIQTTDALYVAAATYPSRVVVINISYAPE